MRSPSFKENFASVTGEQLFLMLGKFCFGKRGPIGSAEISLSDTDRTDHIFFVESFHNGYDTLTFGILR